jgi:hypothetical protein
MDLLPRVTVCNSSAIHHHSKSEMPRCNSCHKYRLLEKNAITILSAISVAADFKYLSAPDEMTEHVKSVIKSAR